jgi:cellulose synthase/poly-beta-1,6-N-acetylglucosamine synthase-like glycosyltransferase
MRECAGRNLQKRLRDKAHWIFLGIFFSLLAGLNIAIGLYFIHTINFLSSLYFIIMEFLNIGVAYGLTEFLLSILLPKKTLPQLEELKIYPRVALLYVTCDDVVPDLLQQLAKQRYPNYDIFVLDDSTKNEHRLVVDRIATDHGFRVVRREKREGYKAGSLNHWLTLYGDQYKYFIILDSDSALDDDFITRMVKYAEHPSNVNVAVFQSKIRAWNTHNFIPKILDTMTPLYIYQQDRLANRFGYVCFWGHNCLCRTELFKKVGGFDEGFISEDHATALNLMDRGYQCKLVDVISYEGVPETVNSYTRRASRWAQQSLELELYKTGGQNVPFLTKLHLFMSTYSFAVWFIFLFGMIMATWGFRSNLNDIVRFVNFIANEQFWGSSLRWPLLIFFFYYLHFTLLRLPLAWKVGIKLRDYLKHLFFSWTLGFVTMPWIVGAQAKVLLGARPSFTITSSLKPPESHPLEFIRRISPTLGLIIVILSGIVWNPISFVFNFLWMIPLILSPLTAYLISVSGKVRGSIPAQAEE